MIKKTLLCGVTALLIGYTTQVTLDPVNNFTPEDILGISLSDTEYE